MEGGNSAGSYETKSHLVPLLLTGFNESGTFLFFSEFDQRLVVYATYLVVLLEYNNKAAEPGSFF